jgi:hypothetical protein
MALAYEGDNSRSKRSYITTAAFNSVIYQYTAQLGPTLKNEGRLTAITASPAGTTLTATNCPAGRILREVGAKLYPGVHPGLAVGDTFSGAVVGTTATNKYWVKVFDAQTGVRGFIDPNAPTFAIYNSDKSIEIQDAAENAGGAPARLGPALPATVTMQRPLTGLAAALATITAAQLVGGIATMNASGGATSLTLPATADIIAQMGGANIGATSEFTLVQTAANNVTITAGDGNTSLGGSVIVNAQSARFFIRIASATTVVVYRAA